MNEIFAFFAGLVALLPGFGPPPQPVYSGYVDADYVYAAAPSGGTIATLSVAEGETVQKGAVLFTLKADQQRAALKAAEARAAAARASWQNHSTGGRREEVEVARASLAKAQADLGLAQATLERSRKLFAAGTVAQARLDQDEANARAAQAQVSQTEAQLAVIELPARNAQLASAEQTLIAAEADAEQARANLAERSVLAPADGRVEEVFYQAGEVAGAGAPVLSLLAPEALVVKFFVPEPDRAAFSPGQRLAISCDGCPAGLSAMLTRIASQPQFTAPIIYSREERTRLVYSAEARLAAGAGLDPGQPVSVGVVK
jgi:HlyD family secretion protein